MSTPKARAILFADILGSVGLYGSLTSEEVEALTADCLKRMQSLLATHSGKMLESGGNELLAIFASADEAWLAADGMMQLIGQVSTSAGKSPGLRIGLHLSLADAPADQEIETAARLTGRARGKQILCSTSFSDALAETGTGIAERPELGQIRQSNSTIAICQLSRKAVQPAPALPPASSSRPAPGPEAETLRLRYQDREFLLETRSPPLTIGRDLANQLIIEDRKVSRRHARIERRPQGYYLVDTSTNGSFLTLTGQREILIRRDEVRLDGRGRICFGSSSNDPQANRIDFEPA